MTAKYGEFNADGSIKTEPDECPVSGHFVNPRNSVRERIADTPYFVRVWDGVYEDVTPTQRGHWKANVPKTEPVAPDGDAPADVDPTQPSGVLPTGQSSDMPSTKKGGVK